MKFVWEKICKDQPTFRAQVPGGWLVKACDTNDVNTEYTVMTMVFVPDPTHAWNLS